VAEGLRAELIKGAPVASAVRAQIEPRRERGVRPAW
jgi:hypothetical protein